MMEQMYAQIHRKCAYMLPNQAQSKAQIKKTNDSRTKKGDINYDPYLQHFSNTWLAKVTQKPSGIVKENEANKNITFNVRQVTNDLKRVPFRVPCFLNFRIFFGALAPEEKFPSGSNCSLIFASFWSFGPRGPQYPPKLQKGPQSRAPRVSQAAPPKLKGRHNEPRD